MAAALAHDGVIDLTTRGARTGRPRTVEIWFLHLAGRLFVTGTSGARHWYANVLADPRVVVHLKVSVRMDLPARAVPVLDLEVRRWVFTRAHRWNDWYLSQEPLDSLVAAAPMVELHLD